jgi:F-box/WD-40 domain protein 7
MYLTKHKIDYNWRFTELVHPDRLKTLKGHDDHVVTCLQFTRNRIVSGSDDNTLRVWNATTGKVHYNVVINFIHSEVYAIVATVPSRA